MNEQKGFRAIDIQDPEVHKQELRNLLVPDCDNTAKDDEELQHALKSNQFYHPLIANSN